MPWNERQTHKMSGWSAVKGRDSEREGVYSDTK